MPETLLVQLRAAPCIRLHMELQARVEFLLRDYPHFVADTELFCSTLQPLIELRGTQTVQRWQALARAQASSPTLLDTSDTPNTPNAAVPGPLAQVVQERCVSSRPMHPSWEKVSSPPRA